MSGRVGMIGVGVMGFAMARNLRQAGFDVVGYDPAPGPRERLAEIGGTVVDAPRLVADSLSDHHPLAALGQGARRRCRRRKWAGCGFGPRDSRDRMLDVATRG